jgi:REP element-mobilizing transposase RayT
MDGQQLFGPRRSLRLPGFHYAREGAYFLTICAFQKRCLFGTVRGEEVELSDLGRIVAECWTAIPQHFPHAELTPHIVMPNHVHGIVVLNSGARPAKGQTEAYQKPVAGSVATLVRGFKAAVTLRARRAAMALPHPIWQRNYFERVLRSGKQYTDALRYILENPTRWQFDKENPQRK